MIKQLLVVIFLSLTSISFAFTQDKNDTPLENVEKIWVDDMSSKVKYIKFKSPESVDLDKHAEWLKSSLKLKSNIDFILLNRTEDNIGQVHYRYQQTIDGYVMEGYHYIVHTDKSGNILSINGDYNPNDISNTINISESKAFNYSINEIPSDNYEWGDVSNRPNGELVVYDSTICYKFDIYSLDPLSRHFIFIDASNGEIVKKIDRIQHTDVNGTAHTKYKGIQTITVDSLYPDTFILVDNARNISTYDMKTTTNMAWNFIDNDNVWNTTTNQDDAALDAHWGAEKTYDYFYITYGLDSYDGNGASINSYVHYSVNYNNAFWNGVSMTYGDGDGVNYSPLTSLDIVAHEITHAVTTNSSNLVYSYESGALNESFSDIFGVTVEYYATGVANWYMGDEIQINGNGFRTMSNPNTNNHPDTYLGNYWFTSWWDNGGVHFNSGVQNYWYYLLVTGGSGTNDNGDVFNVTGIGFDDASDIAYRNLTVYLTPNSQYSDARFYSIQSAIDLFGGCSTQESSTTNAWYAVGLGNEYTNYSLADFVSTTTSVCDTGVSVNFINNSINDSTRLWDFGDGSTDTSYSPSHIYQSNGVYTVTLSTIGSSACGLSTDTLVKTDLITVGGVSALTSCTPIDTISNPDPNYGIFNFKIGDIDNTSSGADVGMYEDFSCSYGTEVEPNEWVPFSINVGSGSNNIIIYIDYDNNGVFTNNTESYIYGNKTGVVNDRILIKGNSVQGVPLRMRIMVGKSSVSLSDQCGINNTHNSMQIEDYTVTINECQGVKSRQSGDWDTPSTWCGYQVPNVLDTVYIEGSNVVNVSTDVSCDKLWISDHGTLNIQGTGVFTVNENITSYGGVVVQLEGILLQNSSMSNDGNGQYRVMGQGHQTDTLYNIWSSPVSQSYIPNTFYNTNACDIFTFEASSQSWKYDYYTNYTGNCGGNNVTFTSQYLIPNANGYMDIGRGYFSTGTSVSTGLRSFWGQVNNGTYLFPIYSTNLGDKPNWHDDDWNLIGNPYPSPISITDFYTLNTSVITGGIYWWDAGTTTYHEYDDYAVYTLLGGVSSQNSSKVPNGYLASCQGAFVAADSNLGFGYITYNNSLRGDYDNTQFFKRSNNDNDLAYFSLSNPNNSSSILLGISDKSTDGIDKTYDARKLESGNVISLSSIIDSMPFTIQGFDQIERGMSKVIPLRVRVGSTEYYKISLDSLVNFDGYDIYLYDSLDNSYNKMNMYDEYFTRLDSGVTDRFQIVFSNNSINSIDENVDEKSINIFQTNSDIKITSSNILNGRVVIYDIIGNMIYNNIINTNDYSINKSSLNVSSGIYIIKYEGIDENINKKIFLK